MFACNGILFNHESPIRGETFVTEKLLGLLRALQYGQETLYLGNLDQEGLGLRKRLCRSNVAYVTTRQS